MKKLILLLLAVCIVLPLLAEEEEQRLDNSRKTSKFNNGFKRDKDNNFYKLEEPTDKQDEYYYGYSFLGTCTITKIVITYDVKITPEFSTLPAPGMYNFEILIRKPKAKEYTSYRKVYANKEKTYKVEEPVVCEAVKVRLLPFSAANQAKTLYYGEFKTILVYGYEGDVLPKQEKIFNYPDEIRTKEDAKKAFKNKEITPEEYIKLLKELPD